MLTRYGLPLLAVALLVYAMVHVTGPQHVAEKVVPVIEPPKNPFPHTVAGAGMVEAQTENIALGSGVPGLVAEVIAKVGDKVAPGAPLFRLDDRHMQAELKYRQAMVTAAEAELSRQEHLPRPEQLMINKAQVAEAEANVANMRDQWNRAQSLYKRKVSTEEDLVTREQALKVTEAQLARAQAEYNLQKAGAWEYDKELSRAAVAQAKAQAQQTETELDRLMIRAPVAGEVLQVNVRPGEFVAAPHNQALVVLGNVQKLHVRVDVDEYDIHRFKTGAPARATLKGQPNIGFPLKFERVEPFVVPKKSLTGDNTERVDTRVLQVIYSFEPGKVPVYVGQQLDVFIDANVPVAGK